MYDQRYRWNNKTLREHVAVLDGKRSPSIVIQHATIYQPSLRSWVKTTVWIDRDRIVFVGDKFPGQVDLSCEIIDASGLYLVAGYIEPHAHPFQLYNPQTLGDYALQTGTTTLVNDNLLLALQQDKKKAFSFLEDMKSHPASMFWWARYDSQTELYEEEATFSHQRVQSFVQHDGVLQGGELTSWPRLLEGDDLLLHWIQETKRARKPIEGHLPGASSNTLAKLKLLGVDSDHESMTGEEVRNRLMHGYTVTLRHSSIRPDLANLLKDLLEMGITCWDQFLLTTDGSTPSFYGNGMLDECVRIVIEAGISPEDAYSMVTYNPARHFGIHHEHGLIATGRVANINFLSSPTEPTPVHTLAKGKWVRKNGEAVLYEAAAIPWEKRGFSSLDLSWDLTHDDLQFSMPIGVHMRNAVITVPYSVEIDMSIDEISEDHDECFFMLIDRNGKWRVNTALKGFANQIGGFASSFSNSGDIFVIGKRKEDMLVAFRRMKELGGGIVLAERGEVLHEIPLPYNGLLSDQPMEEVMRMEEQLKKMLEERGYTFGDPIYTLLFFSSTHLPYVRLTQRGLYDVMKKVILFPSVVR
ncbi:adenine deaminase C-terminal domain-containing protein [Bacillus fonticola]|uniref:adenine deaminase C-terminal domain-containing protein n=1 Tax=Bacillus fonticola TaxID=2728853 RepID=UPI0014756A4A|nr:adenine deaminase C-terminal domain-containing protein [Bacillus fonticola]